MTSPAHLCLDDAFLEILGIPPPLIRMPAAPGQNIAILVKVAARNQLLRARGHHAARLLARRFEDMLQDADAPGVDDLSPEDERP